MQSNIPTRLFPQFGPHNMKTDYQTYATGLGKAAYEIGTSKGRFFVHASDRAQAARILKRDGLIVRDINRVA